MLKNIKVVRHRGSIGELLFSLSNSGIGGGVGWFVGVPIPFYGWIGFARYLSC